jgi:hypothetical protein
VIRKPLDNNLFPSIELEDDTDEVGDGLPKGETFHAQGKEQWEIENDVGSDRVAIDHERCLGVLHRVERSRQQLKDGEGHQAEDEEPQYSSDQVR